MQRALLGLFASALVTMATPLPVELVDMSSGVLEVSGGEVTASTVTRVQHLVDHVVQRSGLAGWGRPAGGSAPGCHTAVLRLDCSGPRQPGALFSIEVQHRRCRDGGGLSVLGNATVVVVSSRCGGAEQGLKAGLGRLARELRVRPGRVDVPRGLVVGMGPAPAPPLWSLRGHQYTAAHFPAMFRTSTHPVLRSLHPFLPAHTPLSAGQHMRGPTCRTNGSPTRTAILPSCPHPASHWHHRPLAHSSTHCAGSRVLVLFLSRTPAAALGAPASRKVPGASSTSSRTATSTLFRAISDAFPIVPRRLSDADGGLRSDAVTKLGAASGMITPCLGPTRSSSHTSASSPRPTAPTLSSTQRGWTRPA